MFKKNDKIILEISDIGSNGEGIGKSEGFAFFVEGALPGETVEILIVKLKSSYGFGKLLNIITLSPDRISPSCPHFPKCGGCVLMHLSYEKQLQHKKNIVKNCLERIGGLKNAEIFDTIGMDNPIAYRNKMQLPVSHRDGRVYSGFFSQRSHRVIEILDCKIEPEINKKIINTVVKFLNIFKISVYDEVSNKGLVRHNMTRIGHYTGEIMICLVLNGGSLPNADKLAEQLKKINKISTFVLNINCDKTNVILGNKNINIFGSGFIHDCIGGFKFRISPNSFFQINPTQTKLLYDKVVEFADFSKNDIVIDAYCGIGTIALYIAGKVKKVVGIEIVPQAILDARENTELNSIHNAEYIEGAAETVLPRLIADGVIPDVIIVDPPRKGCDYQLIESIAEAKPKKIIYVSCDPATLARDLKLLAEFGFLSEKVQPVDMFPWTGHVETVVLMSRVDL